MVNPRRRLPAWYYRLVALTIREARDVSAQDFDEDLSSLSSAPSHSSVSGLSRFSIDSESDDEEDGEIYQDDTVSSRSYNGEDADYYYELKAERKARKRELKAIREYDQQSKDSERAFDQGKEKEVQEMYDSLQNAEKQSKTPLGSIVGRFYLHSSNHVDYCPGSDRFPSKYVEFYHLDKDGAPSRHGRQMEGYISINPATDCYFGPFSPPKHTGLEEFQLTSNCRKHNLVFQFLSHDYIKLKVPCEVAFKRGETPTDAPEVFEFAGIRHDFEKAKEERKRKRSPSPRETYFEMNHPQGWWNQNRGWP
ncbi:predicted protein [Uncinocarpus reesii 1704]|uniref:Uncharacterized protein n=1 Tax=Uncinocarpus reesii (strain UAMH 1704) TaxID=336963 RepID=C4JQ59_UNCRE|nr:uncharacterized protein UREG_03292 [Uncinocarpus reesii 1704]EEP78446.1 predicted protein [Uncinocarpus reesii 1704]